MAKAQKIEQTEEFISLWQLETCLWDVHSKEYHDRNEKNKSFKLLGSHFELSERKVKAKINNLRTYYSKELAKYRESEKSGAGTDEVYISKWPHFNSLLFLKDTIKAEQTTSSLDNDDSITPNLDQYDEVESPCVLNKDPESGDSDTEPADETQNKIPRSTEQPLQSLHKKRKENKQKKKGDYYIEKAMRVIYSAGENVQKEIDEHEAFGTHVAFSLRKMSNNRSKEYAKFKIQEVLFQAQFGFTQNSFQPNAGQAVGYLVTTPPSGYAGSTPTQNFNPSSSYIHQLQSATPLSPQPSNYSNSPVYNSFT